MTVEDLGICGVCSLLKSLLTFLTMMTISCAKKKRFASFITSSFVHLLLLLLPLTFFSTMSNSNSDVSPKRQRRIPDRLSPGKEDTTPLKKKRRVIQEDNSDSSDASSIIGEEEEAQVALDSDYEPDVTYFPDDVPFWDTLREPFENFCHLKGVTPTFLVKRLLSSLISSDQSTSSLMTPKYYGGGGGSGGATGTTDGFGGGGGGEDPFGFYANCPSFV